MIEKPVCLMPDELKTLTDLSRVSGVGVAVNHTRRFDSSHVKVAEVIRSGVLGSFIKARSTYYGGWLHNGGHLVDTLIMFFGQAPEVESSVVSGKSRLGDDDLDVRLTIDGGPIDIEAWDEGDYQLFEIELRFQRGRVRLLDFGATVMVEEVTTNSLNERVLTPAANFPASGLTDPTYRASKAIDAYLRGNKAVMGELGVSLADAAVTMRVLWEARALALGEEDSALGVTR
jgi:predicted dehydrogenase